MRQTIAYITRFVDKNLRKIYKLMEYYYNLLTDHIRRNEKGMGMD